MTFSVNTNNEANTAIFLLNQTKMSLSTTQERINSGFKVGGAKDDAALFAIAQGMRGDIMGFEAISESLSLGEATVNVALSAAETISDTLNDIKQKVVQAQEENVDRDSIQNDIDALVQQVDAISAGAQFNGVNLLSGTDPDLKTLASLDRTDPTTPPTPAFITVATQDLTSGTLGVNGIDVTNKSAELVFDATFTGGASVADGDVIVVQGGGTDFTYENFDDPTATALTKAENFVVEYDAADSAGEVLAKFAAAAEQEGFSVVFNETGNLEITGNGGISANVTSTTTGFVSGTAAGGDPTAALTSIEAAVTAVKSSLSVLGTGANRIETQKSFVESLTNSLEAGVGNLVDANLAEESARLQSLQTKEQLGIQALSIANQAPQAILGLFQ